jgi:hypothetical protein
MGLKNNEFYGSFFVVNGKLERRMKKALITTKYDSTYSAVYFL